MVKRAAKISPLELLALKALPEKARIAKLAALWRAGKFGRHNAWPRKKDIKLLVNTQLDEAWGNRGKLAEALHDEIIRQGEIARRRMDYTCKIYYYNIGDYNPVDARYHTGHARLSEIGVRRLAMCQCRIGDGSNLVPDGFRCGMEVIPINYGSERWPGGRSIHDFQLRNRKAFILLTPYTLSGGEKHRVRFLLYNVRGLRGAIRVSKSAETIRAAVDSLKRRAVIRAEGRCEVSVNWEKGGFNIRHPKRKKVRFIPWIKHARDKGERE